MKLSMRIRKPFMRKVANSVKLRGAIASHSRPDDVCLVEPGVMEHHGGACPGIIPLQQTGFAHEARLGSLMTAPW
ncbi:hypothetical protein E4U41_000908 [Claviceps citrina]|nr:hypothetical protein E4U41_000908 [Claviceps citrina]